MDKLLRNITNVRRITKTFTANTNLHPLLGSPYSQALNTQVTEAEIMDTLKKKLPGAKSISVEDTSGGCGAMFHVAIEATEFKGLSVMKQHRLVYDILKEQIKSIHGIHVETHASK